MDKRDFMRKILQKEEEAEEECLMSKEELYGVGDQNDGPLPETESTFAHSQYPQVRWGASLPCSELALLPWSPHCLGCVNRIGLLNVQILKMLRNFKLYFDDTLLAIIVVNPHFGHPRV